MRLRAPGHPRENIENEILSEFRCVPIGARRNVEEHGKPARERFVKRGRRMFGQEGNRSASEATCFSRPELTRGSGVPLSGLRPEGISATLAVDE